MSDRSQQTIAVIGASQDRRKFGNKCVRAYHKAGWKVYPINPRAETIEGLRAYPALHAVPTAVDRVSLYLAPATTSKLLPSLPKNIPIFFNPGSADDDVLTTARQLGLEVHPACSIVAIGMSPGQFPDSE